MHKKPDWDISRRRLLLLFGAAGAGLLVHRSIGFSAQGKSTRNNLPACIVTPRQTEGPFFVDGRLNRSDIRVDPIDGSVTAGVPLTLSLRVSSVSRAGCAPMAGAVVDVWHCDAAGAYSDVNERAAPSAGKKFLRGYQITGENGAVRFTTIYPGWYPGRAVHIHFKVRSDAGSARSREFTSQLYFDDALTDRVHARQPYASRGRRALRNRQDGLFRNGGELLMLNAIESGERYTASFDIGLQMS